MSQIERIYIEKPQASFRSDTNALVDAYRALPVIVTEPGDYRTRDGRRVTIRTVREGGVTGAVWNVGAEEAPRGSKDWNRNGRVNLFVERGRDIVGRWAA